MSRRRVLVSAQVLIDTGNDKYDTWDNIICRLLDALSVDDRVEASVNSFDERKLLIEFYDREEN